MIFEDARCVYLLSLFLINDIMVSIDTGSVCKYQLGVLEINGRFVS